MTIAHGPRTLGIDVGTSALKAVLLDRDGLLIDEASSAYPLETPRPGWVQQAPDDWWRAARTAIQSLWERGHRPTDVAAVGLTGQMHSLVLLDGAGATLCPALLWCDQRTDRECAEIVARLGEATLLERVGNPSLPAFTLPKLLWVRANWPEAYSSAQAWLLPKDFIRFRLTGVRATDASDGSGTLMYDVRRRCWATDLLRELEVDLTWLAATVEGTEVTGSVSTEASDATGLVAGTPVIGGGSDNAAAAVGLGAIDPGILTVSIGTSGVVFAPLDRYPSRPLDGRLHLHCHAVPDRWHWMSVTHSAGGSFRWLRDALAPLMNERGDAAYDRLLELAERAPVGSDGLVFLPYLTGERTPHADPHARGVFFGLHLGHGAAEMVRAVLEGVAFGLRQGIDLMRDAGAAATLARGTGGGLRGQLWRQILADALGIEIQTMPSSPGAARGAAVLAGLGTGLYPNAQIGLAWPEDARAAPIAAGSAGLQRSFETFDKLYPRLAPAFADLTAPSPRH